MKQRFLLVVVVLLLSACGSDREELPISVVSIEGDRIAVQDSCHDEPRLEVDDDAAAVEIRFTVREASGGDCFSCTEETLDAPLGERAVIDAATGKEVPSTGNCFDPP